MAAMNGAITNGDCHDDNSHVDVLIVGAGPTGLMSALWLAEFGLKVRIIDERGTRALNGRADGFHVRSLEIWDSFGLGHVFANHGTTFGQWALWAPNTEGRLSRQKSEAAIGTDTSRFLCGTMHQGNIEAALIDAIKRRSGVEIERGVVPTALVVDDALAADPAAHAVTVALRRVLPHELTAWPVNAHSVRPDGSTQVERGYIDATTTSTPTATTAAITAANTITTADTVPTISGTPGSTETVRAKYVIGADGGHSWVRRQLGFHMEGASHNAQWGVIDAVLDTDFPDFKKHCTILSPAGTVLSVPRERGLTRLYIQLPTSASGGDNNNNGGDDNDVAAGIASAAHMMASAARILAPYRLSYSYCDWWTVYKVGQRVCDHFADARRRVFLGGDAVHTHTPKGGQGMNVSMQDAYNLGWKLGGVLGGQLDAAAVLPTYEAERRPIARLLIDIDAVLAGNLARTDRASTLDVDAVYEKLRDFNSGANICYTPGALVAAATVPVSAALALAPRGLPLGMRIPPFSPVFNLASMLPVDLQSAFPSDGRWRLLVFAGDVAATIGGGAQRQRERVNALGAALRPLLFTKYARFRGRQQPGAPFLEPLLLCWARCDQIELCDFHDVFSRPLLDIDGADKDDNDNKAVAKAGTVSYDPSRIFVDPPPGKASGGRTESAHIALGVSVGQGCMVLVRPDQCISWVGELDDVAGLDAFLGGVFLTR